MGRHARTGRPPAAVLAAAAVVLVLAAVASAVTLFQPSSAVRPAASLPTAEPLHPLTSPSAVPPRVYAQTGIRVLSRIPTTDRVVFVGIDDGYVRLPEVAAMLERRHLPVSLFIAGTALAEDPAYFRSLVAAGATLEDHTIDHPLMTQLSAGRQRDEVCGQADRAQSVSGRRPMLLRPPYGAYDADTLTAAVDCGIHTVVLWNVAVNDGVVQYQQGDRLQAGDLVLMHFRTTGVEDLSALLRAVDQAGLRIASLEDYVLRLPPPPSASPAAPAPAPAFTSPTRTQRWTPAPTAPPATAAPATTTSAPAPDRTASTTPTATATRTTAPAPPTPTLPPPTATTSVAPVPSTGGGTPTASP